MLDESFGDARRARVGIRRMLAPGFHPLADAVHRRPVLIELSQLHRMSGSPGTNSWARIAYACPGILQREYEAIGEKALDRPRS